MPEKSRRKLLVYYTILWLFLAILGLASVLRSTLIVYPAFACLFLAMGILAGVAFGYFSERRHLKIIEKEGACNIALPSLAAWAVILILIAAAFVLVFAVVFPLITKYYISMGIWDNVSAITYTSQIMGLGFVSLLAAIPAFYAAKAQVVKHWERINQKQIINDSGILKIAVPPTPQEAGNLPKAAGGTTVRGVYKESLANYSALAFSLFFLLMVVVIPNNLYLYPYPAIPFLTLGALTGLALGYLSEKRVLGIMEKKGEYKNSVTAFVGLVVCAVLVFYILPDFLSSYLAVNTVPMTIFFVISLLPVSLAVGALAVHRWEKKKQKRIVSNSRFLLIDGKLYLAPSPAKQESI